MKTTPGPWTQEVLQDASFLRRRIALLDAEGGQIAFVNEGSSVPDAETAQGNADLITAAPELKEALEQFMNACFCSPHLAMYAPLWNAYAEGRKLLDRLNGIKTDEEKE